PFYALEWSGHILETSSFPRGEDASRQGALETLYLMTGVLLFVSLGGQRLGLRAFADSFVIAPPGQVTVGLGFAWGIDCARLVADALAFAISVAVPALVAVMVVELGLGFLPQARSGPLALLAGSPIRTTLILLAILAGFPILAERLPFAYDEAFNSAKSLI